jgi:zinc protease
MTERVRRKLILLLAVFATATTLATAQQAPATASHAATAPLTDAIPVDPQITVGKLPNGLTYYIRVATEPDNRAELRLAVNAGSILEDEDQRGLAHFVEHMAFNGTERFPEMEIVEFMQSIGMRFGAHVNAYTSFDETVYMLQVPTENPDVIDRAFTVLEDWAQSVSFDPAEVEKERGVVMEEWRLGRGAGTRIQDEQLPVLLQGSRYAERLPIGTPEVLQGAPVDRLRQFYADWYRPDLMAVVAVGDFDKAAIEAMIRTRFSSLEMPASPKERTLYPVPDHAETLYTIATDPELPSASVEVLSKMDPQDPTTIGAYRRQIVQGLFTSMLNSRFSEIVQQPDAPFLRAGAGVGGFVRTKDARYLDARVTEDGIERGLDALLTEAERVARFGFTETELERAKTNLARYIERAVDERENQSSGALAAEFIRNFFQREPIPGIVYENELYQRFLPEITLAELNALAGNWTPSRNRVVAASAPEKSGLTVPTDTQLAGVLARAADKELTAYVDTVGSAPLLASAPEPGRIESTNTLDAHGITEWELSNGVKVVLKPTDFKEDEILFRAISPGGTSLASDADYIPANTAARVVSAGGVGELNAIDLDKVLAGKAVNVAPYVSETEEGISGSGSPKDLETLFQLIYLRFTDPRPDPTVFGAITAQMKAAMANQTVTPGFAFSEALVEALYEDHPRRQMMTPERVDEMDLEKSLDFYEDRFADASDFTFTFVGSFELDEIRPLVERYLASLPSLNRNETWKDIGAKPASGIVTRTVEKGIEPRSQTAIVFTGPFEYNQTERVAIRAMADVLQNRLRETLREDLGGTYGVSVGPGYSKFPREEYQLELRFGASPDRLEELVDVVFDEIEKLQTEGPTPKQVSDIKETMLRDLETSNESNGFLLTNIAVRYQTGEDLETLFNLDDYYQQIGAEMIQTAARTYLNTQNYTMVKLFPESRQEQPRNQ